MSSTPFYTAFGNLYNIVLGLQSSVSSTIKLPNDENNFGIAFIHASNGYIGVVGGLNENTTETFPISEYTDGQTFRIFYNGVPGTSSTLTLTFPLGPSSTSAVTLYPQEVYSFVYRASNSGFLVIPGIAPGVKSFVEE